MYLLATAYADGTLGAVQDQLTGLEWLRVGAASGHARSMAALAYHYRTGEVVEKDLRLARQWYERALDGGDINAALALAAMYSSGEFGSRDPRRAAEFILAYGRRGGRYFIQTETSGGFFIDFGVPSEDWVESNPNLASLEHDVRREIQVALIGAGMLDGPADGIIGPKTQEALELWAAGKGQ